MRRVWSSQHRVDGCVGAWRRRDRPPAPARNAQRGATATGLATRRAASGRRSRAAAHGHFLHGLLSRACEQGPVVPAALGRGRGVTHVVEALRPELAAAAIGWQHDARRGDPISDYLVRYVRRTRVDSVRRLAAFIPVLGRRARRKAGQNRAGDVAPLERFDQRHSHATAIPSRPPSAGSACVVWRPLCQRRAVVRRDRCIPEGSAGSHRMFVRGVSAGLRCATGGELGA